MPNQTCSKKPLNSYAPPFYPSRFNYTRELLVKTLEDHCKTQNEMVENDGKSTLDKVSTDHAKLVPLGKVCTAKEMLEKNPPRVQFWTSAKSKTINNVRHITAKVAGKVVSISEASIRTDLIFDDANGIDTLPNQAIFDTIQRMGYEGDLTDEGASSERLSVEQPSPSPAPTSEVPNESLPDSTSAQPSEVPFEQQPDPSPSPSPRPSPQPSPTPTVPDSIPEPTGENLGDHSSNDISLSGNEDAMTLPNVYDLCISLCKQVSDQAKEIKLLKAKITKLKRQATPVIKHFKAYLKTVSLQKRLPRKSSSKKQKMHKKNVSKQGRKIAKGESSVQRDPMFDVMPEDNIDHMETDNAQSEGRTKGMEDEDRVSTEDGVSTVKEKVSTDFEGVSTDFEKVSTDKPKVSTDGSKVSTDEQIGEKEKGEGVAEVEEIDRPRLPSQRSFSHLKLFQRLILKTKGKKVARKVQEEWEAEEERNRLAEEEATNEALIKNFDDIKARIEADRILAEKLQEQEREQFTIEERAKFLHDTIAAQRNESLIKKMKKKDSSKGEEIKQESKEEVKQEDKEEENTRKRKQGTRKKMKSRKRRFKQDTSQDDLSDIEKENDELRLCLTIAPDEDKEVDYEVLDKKYPIIDWKTENLGTKPQIDESNGSEEINLNVVTRSNGQKRFFSTLRHAFSV
ncbi:hypothetical protein Tco_0144696 [Tanacetum coccineum]